MNLTDQNLRQFFYAAHCVQRHLQVIDEEEQMGGDAVKNIDISQCLRCIKHKTNDVKYNEIMNVKLS
jgi:hypothetical protein